MTDPIADLLTRIRNAQMAGHQTVNVPHSKIKEELANLIKENNYLESVKITGEKTKKTLELTLKYINKSPAIEKIDRISTPGRRIYVKADKILKVLSGYGITILSTNKGIITGESAKKKNIGGEIICQIW